MLVQTASRIACSRQSLEGCDHARIGVALARHAGLVVVDETFQQGRILVFVERFAPEGEGAFDHRACTVADKMGEVADSHRRETLDGDGVVEAVDQIRRGIDEGAVEIEDDKRWSWHSLLSSA